MLFVLEIDSGALHVAAQMVSPIFNEKGGRFCPALETSITAKRCGLERITVQACPLACPFNPFNPNAPQAFDSVLSKGLPIMAKWIEEGIGSNEWARRFDAMDRRFHPERDLPLIAYETQWAILSMSRSGEAYAPLWQSYIGGSQEDLRNDARIFIEKLAESRALLLEVTVASNELPYYTCRDLLEPEREYLYVDFGDQEPLEVGAILFGRFLRHENCVYVVPGIFVGTAEVKDELLEEIELYLGAAGASAADEMQALLPEIWSICARIQDEADGVEPGSYENGLGEDAERSEPCRCELNLRESKADAVATLREHPLFVEDDEKEFGFDPMSPTVFDVYVTPNSDYEDQDEFDDEEENGYFGQEEKPVKVGTVFIEADTVVITAMNPVELELLKALVQSLVPSKG